jgi:carbamate kinase
MTGLFWPRPDPMRAVNLNFDADLEVDRNRNLDKLMDDLLQAVDTVLTAHGRAGSVVLANLHGNGPGIGRLYMRSVAERMQREAAAAGGGQ